MQKPRGAEIRDTFVYILPILQLQFTADKTVRPAL
jgi:hypothetical protein